MNISCLMVHPQKVEETRVNRSSMDVKRARSYDGGSSKCRRDIQDNPTFKKKFTYQVSSKFPKACGERVSNPKPQKERSTNSPNKKPTCGICGKKHYGEGLIRKDIALDVEKVDSRLGITQM